MAELRRKELQTEDEIHRKTEDLTLGIKHATLECQADKSKQPRELDLSEQLKVLEDLEAAVKDYKLALRERELRRRESQKDRDSGISIDRSSVLSRDSYPVQEIGESSPVLSIHPTSICTTSHPIEHTEETQGAGQLTNTEEETLRRHGNFSAQRRTNRERQNIVSETIHE